MSVEEVFPSAHYDFQTLVAAYQTEMDGLGFLAETDKLRLWLPRFADYSGYLSSLAAKARPLKRVDKITRGSRIIDCYAQDKWLRDALLMAQLAAVCGLIDGTRLPESQLTRPQLRAFVGQQLERYRHAPQKDIDDLTPKLQTIDAVRSMQILRCLGLVTVKSEDIRLLGFGVADGDKELMALHMEPLIEMQETLQGKALLFRTRKVYCKDAVLFDSDPQYEEHYKRLSNQIAPPVIAIRGDSVEGMKSLKPQLAERGMQLRNFVSILRIDHRMLPDAKGFLRMLLQHVENDSDFVLTMGSGHNPEQYRGREEKIREIFKILSRAGMKPVIIKLHTEKKSPDDDVQQTFGIKGIATFEILHCKLSPQAVSLI